ncbi:MAG TPA: type II restriction endonuclease [Bacteroidetes bacterium]|nr:type II restriction endonuclease [Bacteroidota bacterium]HRI46345.1 hypothetical protein [Ignavibacteriaceae bacterium]
MADRHQDLIDRGSLTARNGFKNEDDVVLTFNEWKTNSVAQDWLKAMQYKINEIESVTASKVRGHFKADVQLQINVVIKLKSQLDVQNLQVKLVSNKIGFNQIDKRWVDKYIELWDIPNEIGLLLKEYTGEVTPNKAGLRDSRRIYFNEMRATDREKIIDFFIQNKIMIVSDLLRGRGSFTADWMLVIHKVEGKIEWVLKSINHVMNVFGGGDVEFTANGNLKIGKISMQRKGGDGGRMTANMLQFKINPIELFN